MADIYVDSVGGSNTSPYDTWAKAAILLDTALVIDVAGDTVYVSHLHRGTRATGVTFAFVSDVNHVTVISADATTGEPPSTYTRGGRETTTGGGDLTLTGQVQTYGMDFVCGDSLRTGDNFYGYFNDTTFELTVNSASDAFFMGKDNSCFIFENGCTFEVANTGQGWQLEAGGLLRLKDFSIAGATKPTNLIENVSTRAMSVIIEDSDFSAMSNASSRLISLPSGMSDGGGMYARVSNCKLNANLSIITQTIADAATRIEAFNIDSGDTINKFAVDDLWGKTIEDTSNFRTATYDGTNGYSAKIVTNANAKEYTRPHRFKLCSVWVEIDKTITVEFIHEGVGSGTGGDLQDDEFFIEAHYSKLADGAFGQVATTLPATVLTTPADIANSTEAWTEVLTGEIKQKLSIDLTGLNQKGTVDIWVYLCKPSVTVYVDPHVDLT